MKEYPSDDELKTISEWDYQDFPALAEYVCGLWHWSDLARLTGKRILQLRLATGGWSGNEDIIRALDKNPMFNLMCWQMSKRGGLHTYRIERLKFTPEAAGENQPPTTLDT